MSTDEITLTIPRDRPFLGVARLVLGGLAARLDLSYEHLEDLQLAVDSLLASDALEPGSTVTIEARVREQGVEIALGPVDEERLRADLERDDGIALGRLLRTTVEGVDVERRDGAAWVRFEKGAQGAAA